MTSGSDDRADTKADHPAQLLAEMRASVETATTQIDELTSELTARRALVDDLESLVDLLLAMGDTPIVVIDDRRRISGLSRVAAERLDGAALGKPLSSVLPGPMVDQLAEVLDRGEAGQTDLPVAGGHACIKLLPGGGAVLVLTGS